MNHLIMAQANGRTMGGPDKIFGVSNLAKKRIAEIGRDKVINSTIGALLDDDGQLIVLSSVVDVLRDLEPKDYAEYAPIAGIPDYAQTIKKAVFGTFIPKSCVEVCYSPGGTGAIRNAIQNYTKPGDTVLTGDWNWSPYSIIASEIQRKLATYTLFDENGHFNHRAFDAKVKEIYAAQDQCVIIINTPAHNPTGYTFTLEDWDYVLATAKEVAENPSKKVILLADIAYLDFSGDAEEYRRFFSKLSGLAENILPLIAFSASKGYTLYGMRCGALLCMAPNQSIADEFKMAVSFSSRGTWSNGTRAAMTVLCRIFSDPALLAKVTKERHEYLAMLTRRGTAFMTAAKALSLKTCPFDSGFFITVPCDDAEAVGTELQKSDVFAIPLGKGVRISIASISEAKCAQLPQKIQAAIKAVHEN